MKRIMAFALALLGTYSLQAEEMTFNDVRMTVPGKKKPVERQVQLAFVDRHDVLVRLDGKEIEKAPVDSIDRIAYEYAKKHRIATGAVIMVASLGAGAVVMLTKSTSHWLDIDYHDGTQTKAMVMKLDKKTYRQVIAAVEAQTGKKVEMLGQRKKKE